MSRIPNSKFEQSIAKVYQMERSEWRDTPVHCERLDSCLAACEDELRATRPVCSDREQFLGFVGMQLRCIRPVTWAAFALIAVATVAQSQVAGPDLLVFALAGSLLALACVTGVARARSSGMLELEASCAFNAVSVALARVLILGAASALVTACAMFLAAPHGVDSIRTLMVMTTPYFVSCAGGLMCARRAASVDALSAALVWCTGVAAVCVALFMSAPAALASASLWVWALACSIATVWCVREVRAWMAAAAGGLIAQQGTYGI